MKYLLISIVCLFVSAIQKTDSIYVCREVKTRLFSEAPMENIDATSVKGFSVLNLGSGEVQFNIPIRSLQFKKALMQEHFNENYMESDKYPNAAFKGTFSEKIDPSKDGEYSVKVTGELDVHGVKQQRTITGIIKVLNKQISITSQFNVLCKDHKITIPTLVIKNIAESIQVTVSGNFVPYSSTKT